MITPFQRLEDTHPELATFIKDVCRRKRPYGIVGIDKGPFQQLVKKGIIVRSIKIAGMRSVHVVRELNIRNVAEVKVDKENMI